MRATIIEDHEGVHARSRGTYKGRTYVMRMNGPRWGEWMLLDEAGFPMTPAHRAAEIALDRALYEHRIKERGPR